MSLVSSSGAVTQLDAKDVLSDAQLERVRSPPATAATAPVDIGATSSTTALFYHPDVIKHPGSYCEVPLRCKVVWDRLVQQGVAQRCVLIGGRPFASIDTLALVHSRPYAELVAKFDQDTPDDVVDKITEDDSDTEFTVHSCYAARLSVGGLILLLDRCIAGVVRNGFAVIRPPGKANFVPPALHQSTQRICRPSRWRCNNARLLPRQQCGDCRYVQMSSVRSCIY